jgi:hypothetical protein
MLPFLAAWLAGTTSATSWFAVLSLQLKFWCSNLHVATPQTPALPRPHAAVRDPSGYYVCSKPLMYSGCATKVNLDSAEMTT